MISGIVYFEEILENIKDITGIEILANKFEQINRFIFNAEKDIGAGGLIVRKKKQYEIGDGNYDGNNIIMPYDFVGESSYHSLSDGVINGNILTLNCKGPNKIDVKYLGFLLDSNGNAFTTRNHLDACVYYARHRLYSAKVFQKTGSQSMYREFKQEYNDEVLAARGNDAFPTEEQWNEISYILNGGAFEAYTNCGMASIGQTCNDNTAQDESGGSTLSGPTDSGDLIACNLVSLFNSSLVDNYIYTPLITFSPSINASALVTGVLTSFTQVSFGRTDVTGTLISINSISGSASGYASLSA